MWRVLLLEESRSRFDEEGGGGPENGRSSEVFVASATEGKGERGKGREIPPRQMPESNPESGIRFSVAYTLWPPPGPNLRHEPEQRAGRSTTSLVE